MPRLGHTDQAGSRLPERHDMKGALRDWAVAPNTLPCCGTLLQNFAERCVRAIQGNRDLAMSGDPSAIHTMRIELTKLRAAALFFQPLIVEAEWSRINKELGWLNSALGRARNCDVLVEYAERKRYRRWASRSRLTLLRSRDKAHRRLAKELGSARYSRLTSELDRWLAKHPWRGNGRATRLNCVNDCCEERLRAWREALRDKARHIRVLRRKQVHRLRIQSKNYRYMVDSLLGVDIPISGEDLAFRETAKLVHRALGEFRDLRRFRKSVERRPPHYRKHKRKLIQRVEKSFR